MRLVALLAIAFSLPAAGQSLTEAAQKEKERRQKLRDSGAPPAAVVSQDELAAGKGALANDPSIPPAVAPDSRPASRPVPRPAAAQSASAEASWRSRASAARVRIEVAERALRAANEQADPLVVIHRQPHSGVASDLTQAAKAARLERIRRAELELAVARKALDDLEEQARRASVPPGWLR